MRGCACSVTLSGDVWSYNIYFWLFHLMMFILLIHDENK
jgi:hypothetical protein